MPLRPEEYKMRVALMSEVEKSIHHGGQVQVLVSSDRTGLHRTSIVSSAFEFQSADQILDYLGFKSPIIMYTVLCMAICWSLAIMTIMCSHFYETGIECEHGDKKCIEEANEMRTIEKQFFSGKDQWLGPEWSASIFFIGDLLGGITLSYYADVHGRKKIVFPSMFIMGFLLIVSTFATTLIGFLVLRFMAGFFLTASFVIVWVHASECISSRYHIILSVIFGFTWVIGYACVALIATFLHDWRQATVIVAVPQLIISFSLWFTIPESFQFVVEKRQTAELHMWLKSSRNPYLDQNVDAEKFIQRTHKHKGDDGADDLSGFVKYLREHGSLIKIVIMSACMWIFTFLWYLGLSMQSTSLGGDAYKNFLLSGLVEIPGHILNPVLLKYLGRKRTTVTVYTLGTICLLGLSYVENTQSQLYLSVWLCAKSLSAAAFMNLFINGAVIFPTAIRNSAMGICAVCSNIGASIGPHIPHLKKFGHPVPWIVFGLATAASGILANSMPKAETDDEEAPNGYVEVPLVEEE
ncbi:unnamed protein product [Bursaphelenchus okinawaensis]|uniref:Major facilitator superfamily (MFS) profile domain-containing protein n=1 Tax=Bursaphelenchus okinawaensis TaxID=465554 RepID=A0A811KZ21_9BILA|nr:unnamed protein product [Bursaphelenchus okinawaensis]CAG9114049.1 unnamed protein product [Bursaphelenchus okinawaensis]